MRLSVAVWAYRNTVPDAVTDFGAQNMVHIKKAGVVAAIATPLTLAPSLRPLQDSGSHPPISLCA
jgi:hypothetical protein